MPEIIDGVNYNKDFELVKKIKAYSVIPDRVGLYQDFVVNLIHWIDKTYLGRNYIKTMDDINGHFRWCFEKVLSEFEEEEISFYHNSRLYDYFLDFFLKEYYSLEKSESISHYLKFWKKVFDLAPGKNEFELDLLVNIYEIFDESLSTPSINLAEI